MIKRTSRNFKVPLVYGGQWKDHQSFQKWDPIGKRLVTVNCCLPQKCFEPEPVTNVTLTSMISGGAVVSWTYAGPTGVLFEINIYEGITETVDTSGTPKYSVLGGTSGVPYFFSNTAGYYYVASVRVRNNCLFSPYAYSSTVRYLFSGYQYINVNYTGTPPDNGQLWIDAHSSPLVLGISSTIGIDTDLTSWLTGTVAICTYIKIQKDLSNYVILERLSNTNNTSYWTFQCNPFASSGSLNDGDEVVVTTT